MSTDAPATPDAPSARRRPGDQETRARENHLAHPAPTAPRRRSAARPGQRPAHHDDDLRRALGGGGRLGHHHRPHIPDAPPPRTHPSRRVQLHGAALRPDRLLRANRPESRGWFSGREVWHLSGALPPPGLPPSHLCEIITWALVAAIDNGHGRGGYALDTAMTVGGHEDGERCCSTRWQTLISATKAVLATAAITATDAAGTSVPYVRVRALDSPQLGQASAGVP